MTVTATARILSSRYATESVISDLVDEIAITVNPPLFVSDTRSDGDDIYDNY